MYLKNRNISSKTKRSKVTDYAALMERILEVIILKGTQLMKITAHFSSYPGDLRLSGSIIRKSRFMLTKERITIRQKSGCSNHSKGIPPDAGAD